jgi:hypothetical protein
MAIPQSVPLSPRAQQYFNNVFKPKYEALQQAVKQTPLAILVWGPGKSQTDYYRKRLQIRYALRQRGHAAFFSEELAGASPPAPSQKAIEFLQAQAADLVVVLQVSFGSVAEVHDFANFRVISQKMLIFISESAKDGYSFQGALKELRILYGNVETFTDQDIVQCNLVAKVLEKVNVLQMVKYRDLTNAASWAQLPVRGGVA